jgi:fructokinase
VGCGMTTDAQDSDQEPIDKQFLVIGESLIDLVADPRSNSFTAHAGGSPFNVAVGLARLGQRVTLVTEYGEDHCGRILAARLEAEGVRVRRTRHTTSIAIAALGPGGAATYDFWFHWGLGVDDIRVRGPFAGVHIGSLSCLVEPGRHATLAAATEARRLGMAVSFDPNIRPSLAPERSAARRIVESCMAVATIVKASVDDIEWLYPDEDPVDRARGIALSGERLVVLTDGARGCITFASGSEVSVAAPRVAVIDTVGAGDSFTAALLAHLQTDGALHQAPGLPTDRLRAGLEFASRVAALTCTRAGAYQPSPADLQQFDG